MVRRYWQFFLQQENLEEDYWERVWGIKMKIQMRSYVGKKLILDFVTTARRKLSSAKLVTLE